MPSNGRRPPPAVPHLDALIREPGRDVPMGVFISSLRDVLRKITEYFGAVQDAYSGAPAPHADTHLVGKSDALQTPGVPVTVLVGGTALRGSGPSYMREDARLVVGAGTPTHPTGQTASQGSAFTAMRSDATIQQGIVTTRGDLLTFGTLPDRLPLGEAGTVLQSDGTDVVYGPVGIQGLYFYNQHEWRDQFIAPTVDAAVGGVAAGTQIGQLGWNGPAAAQVANQTGETAHPGIVRVTSGTATGVSTPLSLGSVILADIGYAAAIVRIPTITAAPFRFGLKRTVGGAGEAVRGIYFSFLPASSANWRTVTRDGGGITVNTSAVPVVAGNWFLLEIFRNGAGDVDFYVNTALVATHSANIEAAEGFPVFEIETTAAGVAKTMDVDFFWMQTIVPLAQQWT
jgi:hypothetical protein